MNGQVVALLLALLTVGVFAGSNVFHQTSYGDQWLRDTAECNSRYGWQPDASGHVDPELLQLWSSCMGDAAGWLVIFEVGFVALAVLATTAAALLGPLWSVWRRRWRAWPPALVDTQRRVAELAAAAGHRRVPRLLLGSNSLRDALASGIPGRYAIVLPKKLAIAPDSDLLAATVRHELAHVRRHDVLVAWSTRPAVRVAGALLVIPVIGALLDSDPSLLPGYLWRAAVLLLTTAAICAVILRAREFEADALSVARPSDREALLQALAQARPTARRGRWRRLSTFHPGPEERSAALLDPARSATVRFLDILGVSFLVSVALPLMRGLAADNSSWVQSGTMLTSLLGGVVLGLSVGAALWRSAYVRARSGQPFRPLPALLGVLAGFLAGSVVSLASAAKLIATSETGLAALFTPVLAAGAAALVASAAAFSASRAAVRPRPMPRALLRGSLCALPFVCAFQASNTLVSGYEGGGLSYVSLSLFGIGHPSITAFVVLLGGCGWVLALRWGGRSDVLTALALAVASGTLGVVVLVTYRLRNGPALDDIASFERLNLVLRVLAAVGLVAALAVVARLGRPGWGMGLATGTAAAAVGGMLFPVANAILFDAPDALQAGLGLMTLSQGLVFLVLALSSLAGWLVLGILDGIGRVRSSGSVSAEPRA